MKTKHFLSITAAFIFSLYHSQSSAMAYVRIEGIWKGNIRENADLHSATLEILKSKENNNSYHLTLSNSRNEKFYITKSSITENPLHTYTITIEEAGLSYCANCKFTQGKVVLTMIDEKMINLSIRAVGPAYWRTYDVQEGMPDVSDLVLTREAKQ